MRHVLKPIFAAVAAALAGCVSAGVNVFDQADVNAGALEGVRSAYVAPVEVRLDAFVPRTLARTSRDGQRRVSEADQARLADDLKTEIERALAARGVALLDAPADGAASVRAVLTEANSSRPSFGELSGDPSLSAQSVYAGGGAVEIVVEIDGETVASFADENRTTLGDEVPRVGIWQDLERDFERWAAGLASIF